MSRATEYVVVFGVFLVAVSVIGVTIASLLQGLASNQAAAVIKHLNEVKTSGPVLVLCATAFLAAVAFVIGSVSILLNAYVACMGRHRVQG